MLHRNKRTQIYRTKNSFVYPTGNGTFSLEGVINGRRIRTRSKTLGEAKTKCHSIEEGKQDENITRTTLNGKQLRDAERAYELLPNGSNLSEAVELLIGNLRVTKISILNGVLEYLKTKEQRSVSTVGKIRFRKK